MHLALLATFLLHPVHETFAEVEWNDDTGRMEVALRLSLLDEQWIQRRIDTKATPKVWAAGYLQKTFRFYPAEKPSAEQTRKGAYKKLGHKYHWVGRKEDGSHVWWFFEVEPDGGKMPKSISQKVLFEREENYVNRVLILGETPKRALALTSKKPLAPLKQANADPSTATGR